MTISIDALGRASLRTFFGIGAVVVAASIGNALAATDAPYPNRPLHIVVPFSPGGVSDTLARIIGDHFQRRFGQSVVIENRPGASGNIASEIVAKAAPDGYTLLITGNNVTILPSTSRGRAVDPVHAFAPVMRLVTQPILIAIHPAFPVTSLSELVTLARSEPGKLAYGSAGIGTTDHLAAAVLWLRAGANVLHVPYANTGQEVKELLQGEIKVSFITMGPVAPHLKRGDLKALAVTSRERVAAIPDVPTVAESGFPGFEVMSWFGAFAPAGTPGEIVDKLNREITRILELPDVREKCAAMGAEPAANTSRQFAEDVRALVEYWAPIADAAGIHKE